MKFPQDQIDELKCIVPLLSIAEEGGYTYLLIEGYKLPDGLNPSAVDLLLCPMPRDQYQSRLYFSQQVTGCPKTPNWNGNVRVVGKNWIAFSWRTNPGLRLADMLLVHLSGLRSK
jgi:hypothetical protein